MDKVLKPILLAREIPPWIWFSFLPTLGGLSITYAGYKTKTNSWLAWGLGLTVASFLFSSSSVVILIWLSQIGFAFYIRKPFLAKTSSVSSLNSKNYRPSHVFNERKVDVNNCSKHELVHLLGLPIVYANDIDSLRSEGYIFTSIEELAEIVGISDNYLKRIEPLMLFTYDHRKEAHLSWRCLNVLSAEELSARGFALEVAQKIVEERRNNGEYRTLVDVKRRTGVPFSLYGSLFH